MIYVLNNGRDYSDETIYFIDVPPEKRDTMEKLAKRICTPRPYRTAYVVGIFDVIEWRDRPGSLASFEDFANDAPTRFYDCFDDEVVEAYPVRRAGESIEDFVDRLAPTPKAAP